MSSNPMRYSPAFGGGRTMEEDERGKYVKFDDYAAATSRAESAEQLAETVASQLRAAVDAFEAAEGKLEKASAAWDRYRCSACKLIENQATIDLDAILAPDTSGDGK